MNAAATEIAAIAKAVAMIHRAELFEPLIDSMYRNDQEIEALWADEAEDRDDALLRGEITVNPEPQILTEFRARQR